MNPSTKLVSAALLIALVTAMAAPSALGEVTAEGDIPDGSGGQIHVTATVWWEQVDSFKDGAFGHHSATGYAYGSLAASDPDAEGGFQRDECFIPVNGLDECTTGRLVVPGCQKAEAQTGNLFGQVSTGWLLGNLC